MFCSLNLSRVLWPWVDKLMDRFRFSGCLNEALKFHPESDGRGRGWLEIYLTGVK